jgi:hypothetical protein
MRRVLPISPQQIERKRTCQYRYDASQLRTVLGVSVSLYSDSYLDEIINTAEAVILPMLVANTSAINSYKLESTLLIFTVRSHHFVVGQVVIVTGLPAPFTATHTVVTAVEYSFTAALTSSNVTLREIIPMGTATLSGYSAADIYANSAPIESAILGSQRGSVSVTRRSWWTDRGVDFTSTPYRMGRSLTNRVSTLLMPYLDVETVVQ